MISLTLPESFGTTEWASCVSLNPHIREVLVGENKQE